MTGRLQKFRNR